MGNLSIWHWLILLMIAANYWATIRIVWRSGCSPLWLIFILFPFAGAFGLLWFSYVRWPATESAPLRQAPSRQQ